MSSLAGAVGHLALPAPLADATLSRAEVTFKTSGSFSLDCDVQFPVDGRVLDLDLKVQIDRANGVFTAEFSGTATIGGLDFALAFSKDPTETRFLAAYTHDEVPRSIHLADLLAVVSPSLAKEIDLSVDLKEVVLAIAADTASTRAAFALDLGEFDLSHLPLVGSQLRDAAKIKDLQVVAAPTAPATGDVAAWNGLLTQTGLENAKPLPATIDAGVSVTAVMSLGEQVAPISLPAAAPAPPTSGDGKAPAAPAADGTKWFPIKRSFGPVYVDRVGARYDSGPSGWCSTRPCRWAGCRSRSWASSVGSPLDRVRAGVPPRRARARVRAGRPSRSPARSWRCPSRTWATRVPVRRRRRRPGRVARAAAVGSYAGLKGQDGGTCRRSSSSPSSTHRSAGRPPLRHRADGRLRVQPLAADPRPGRGLPVPVRPGPGRRQSRDDGRHAADDARGARGTGQPRPAAG